MKQIQSNKFTENSIFLHPAFLKKPEKPEEEKTKGCLECPWSGKCTPTLGVCPQ